MSKIILQNKHVTKERGTRIWVNMDKEVVYNQLCIWGFFCTIKTCTLHNKLSEGRNEKNMLKILILYFGKQYGQTRSPLDVFKHMQL